MSSIAQQDKKKSVGRRKTAIARVILTPGNGKHEVNGQSLDIYFPRKVSQKIALQPLALLKKEKDYNIKANLTGGGKSGQAGALRHGIARALILDNPAFRAALKAAGYLTRDPRMKERKKYGQPGARRRFQFSKR